MDPITILALAKASYEAIKVGIWPSVFRRRRRLRTARGYRFCSLGA